MLRQIRIILLSIVFTATSIAQIVPVQTKKVLKTFEEYGTQRIDDYFWLSDPKDSAVIAHLNEENTYTAAMLRHTEGLQKTIYDELIARIEQKYESLPVKKNGYWYYTRYEEGKQYPFYCRRSETMKSPEEVMMNVNTMATGHQIFLVRGYSVSPSNQLLAFGIDTLGDRKSALYIKNLKSSSISYEAIGNTSGNYVWALDNTTLFYVLNDQTIRAYKVMCHVLGRDPSKDIEVYTERDSTYGVNISATKDGAYIFINSYSFLSDETRYLKADRPTDAPVIIQERQKDLLYKMADYEGSTFFFRTNKDAKNFKLVQTPIVAPGMNNWVDVITHRSDALLEYAEVFKNYIIAQQRVKGLTQIQVIERQKKNSHIIDFGEDAYVAYMSTATDAYNLDSIRYTYSSLTTPQTDYRYDLNTREKILLKQQKIGGGYDQSLYETKRLWAKAGDSVSVPLTVVYKKSHFKKDGSNPLLLYAYGSYGYSTDPEFNRWVISLIDRGFIYGIAHIRGGQEMGRQWYEDGKMLKKKNTFTDFIACAEHLIAERYTAADKLFANGISAGGMLMGAITNLRPDLFRGILAEVPWMDVITDMLNPDLPLTTLEYDEWGSPTKKEQYDYMRSWSPYDNVKDALYPAILATGGLNDTQVPYFSPAKWVAKVRDHNKGANPVLFKCNMGAGHGGESGRFEMQKLRALKYAFMLDLMGIKN